MFWERRARYFTMRRAGVPKEDAMRELDLDWKTVSRYERWHQAIEAGQVEEPVWPYKEDE